MTAVAEPVPRRADLGRGRVTPWNVIRAEWIKLRTLRSTWWSLFATFVFIVGLGTLFSAVRAHRFNQEQGFDRFTFDPTLVSLRGIFLAQLAIGVLGVLVISGEYTTGMIRSSLAAVPRRLPVLVAKTLVFGLLALVVSEVGCFLAFLLGQKALASTHQQATLSTPGALRAIVGAGLYLTVIGLFGVGLGFVVRSTAGAIATLVGIVLVLPLLAEALPSPYNTDVGKYLPLNAGTQILQVRHPDPGQLAAWPGLGVAALYALAALVVGAILLKRRDA